jgi:hypothetical protein
VARRARAGLTTPSGGGLALLEVVGQAGTNQVTLGRALLTSAGYVAVAAAVTVVVFRRRDVTS